MQAYEEPEAETDNPDKAWEFRRLSLMDENGNIPADGLTNAKQQIDAMPDSEMGPSERLSRSNWTWIGPGNIGGRIRSIAIHPTDTNIMWVGGVTGGIWKTTNGGTSWFLLDDFMANMAVTTMVIDPTNPLVLYAGTGEGFTGNREISEPRGAGVFKTTDGGTTWAQLAATNTSDWYFVNRLVIHPTNPLILLAATNSGAWRTTDGGTTWTKTYSWSVADINFNPNDGTKAVLGELYDSYAAYSTDGGVTWTDRLVTSGGGRVEVAYAPSDPSIVYASVNKNGGEIWKSTDGGVNFTLVNTGSNFLATQGWYDNIIWVDPTNSNTLIVGGIDLWRSTNGGSGISRISDWRYSPYSAHADQHIIVEKPGFNGTSNTTVYFGNDGGIYRADNVYTVSQYSGWQELNNNLGITQFYGAAGNPTTGKIIGGTQDNGTLLYTPTGGSEGWTEVEGGDGGWAAADPLDGNYLYGEYTYGNIHRSSNGGASAEYIDGQYWDGSAWTYKSAPYLITDARDSTCNFIAPFVLDPNNNNRLLVGCRSLWRTNDVKAALTPTTGPGWYAIKTPTTGNSNISAVVVSPSYADIIWVGHVNGDVYKTTNGTAATPTWTKVDELTPSLPNRYVTRITIDKNDNNKVYVTFGGFSEDNIWLTSNGGTNWTDITGGTSPTGLPQLPVRSLVIHPSNSDQLFIGTELGLFVSEDGGTTWGTPHQGPTNTPVDELFWMDQQLVAVTYGRGLFVQNTAKPLPTSPTFGDVPMSHPYWSDVEILYANGLTAGCSTTSLEFCPDMTMNRAQSAVFMVRGKFGDSYSPPPPPWLTFGDDFSSGPWAQPWAQGMFNAGLTAGCSTTPRLFCPWEEMPRFQAAVFGLRLKYGDSYPPPAGTGTVFADLTDPTLWYAGWAEQAYNQGLLPACGSEGGKPLFCPNDLVPRGLAAYMIVRAKNLSMP